MFHFPPSNVYFVAVPRPCCAKPSYLDKRFSIRVGHVALASSFCRAFTVTYHSPQSEACIHALEQHHSCYHLISQRIRGLLYECQKSGYSATLSEDRFSFPFLNSLHFNGALDFVWNNNVNLDFLQNGCMILLWPFGQNSKKVQRCRNLSLTLITYFLQPWS